ncbi:MAG: DUF2807 domain-containing protein [Bacteroidetes bacterium]|nr:DUF2807 domain-containing protein [Bacteroidota bacterium]
MLAQRTVNVESFNKVIISPHIEVTFVEGITESILVENSQVADDKLNIEVAGKTLRVYLEGTKNIPKNKKEYVNGHKIKRPLYKGTQATVTITYVSINEASLRGEERISFQSRFDQEKLRLKIYGESRISFSEVKLDEMHTTIYGESILKMKAGTITKQKIVAYGESKVDMEEISNKETTVTAYGEAEFVLNASDKIKVTAFGEAVIGYKGSPIIKKGINIGDVQIYAMH